MPDEIINSQSLTKQKSQTKQRPIPQVKPESEKNIWLIKIGLPMVLAGLLWSYWPTIIELWKIWMLSDEYSSGLLVPLIAVYIVMARRQQIFQCRIKPSFWGILLFVAAQALRYFGLLDYYSSAERLSLVMTVAALVLMLFGWQLFRKVFTIILFLCLMLPLPRMLEAQITLPLQSWATTSAVFCLETFGYDVIREGNFIQIGSTTVNVDVACAGLRMVTAFLLAWWRCWSNAPGGKN